MKIENIIKHSLFKGVITYSLADVIQKAISFITLPIFSHYILPEELGMVANYDVIVSVIILASGQATINGLTYFFYKHSKAQMAQLVSSLLFIVITMNILFGTILMLCNKIVEEYLAISIGFQLLAIVCSLSNMLSSVDSVLFRLEDKPKAFVTLNLSASITATLLMCYFVINKELGGVGKIYGQLIAIVFFCIIHMYLLYKRGYMVFRIKKEEIKTLLKFGVPLLPHSLSFWIKSGMDKILLTSFCGLAVNGLYSMAMSFGAIYSLFLTSFTYAYSPYLQKRLSLINPENENEEKIKIVKLSYKVMIGFMVIGIIVVGLCWLVINFILDSRYLPSFQFIPWIIISLTIYSMYSLTIEFAYTKKRTGGIGSITLTGSLIQCFLTYIFLQIWGQDGIKYSLVIGSLIIMIGIWIFSNKVYPMPWLGIIKNRSNKKG